MKKAQTLVKFILENTNYNGPNSDPCGTLFDISVINM